MPYEIQIFDLKDRPEFATSVSYWIEHEWEKLPIHAFFDAIHNKNKWFLNYPLTLVASFNNIPVGTISLLLDDLETRTEYNPWVGCLYVVESHRKKGIAKKLMKAIEDRCIKEFGLDIIYLFTENQENLYEKLGWLTLEQDSYNEKKIVIMCKTLAKSIYENKEKQVNLIIDFFDKAPVTMWACNSDYKIILWNSGAETIYGYKKEDVIGQIYIDVFIDPLEREQSKVDCDKIINEGYTQRNCLATDVNQKNERREMLTNVFRIQSPLTGEFYQAEMGVLINDLADKQKEYKSFRELMQYNYGKIGIDGKKEQLIDYLKTSIIHLKHNLKSKLKEIDTHYKKNISSKVLSKNEYEKMKTDLQSDFNNCFKKINSFISDIQKCTSLDQFTKIYEYIDPILDDIVNLESQIK